MQASPPTKHQRYAMHLYVCRCVWRNVVIVDTAEAQRCNPSTVTHRSCTTVYCELYTTLFVCDPSPPALLSLQLACKPHGILCSRESTEERGPESEETRVL
ncbi:unnamed protein product, partial [Ectocarpus fasciculatus]